MATSSFDRKIEIKDKERVCQVRKRKFCNKSCSAKYNNKLRISKYGTKYCLNCNKQLLGRKHYKTKLYCNNKCYNEYIYKKYIDRWKNGLETGHTNTFMVSGYVRRYLFEKYNNKCCKCEWSEINIYTGKIPLQINHLDGNWKNNKEKNLELICPNCHTLTPNYGSLNKGNGRPGKINYRQV